MEANQFDELTKRLAAPVSRRLALKAVLATAAGGLFALNRAKDAGAATCDAGHALCTAPNGNSRCIPCASGMAIFVPGNGPGTGCQCCPTANTCTQNGKTTCASACPGGTHWDAASCTCLSTCETDEVLCNGNCVEACPNGTLLDANCNCQCLSPTCGPSENQVCPNFFTDINNCGSCGNSCGSPLKPSTKQFTTPACCNGACTDLFTDNANCGTCGIVCTGGQTCVSGTCTCPGTTVLCGGACVDLTSSNSFCSSTSGTCGTACPTGTRCVNGVCSCCSAAGVCAGACVAACCNGACCPAGIPCGALSGSIIGSDPTQTGRLNRGGTASTCGNPNTCSTVAGTYHYKAYTFTNTSSSTQCVTASLSTACTGTNFIFAGAYLDSFDPANICTGNIGDGGLSPNPNDSFSFNVPAGHDFVIVIAEVFAGSGCTGYTLNVGCATTTSMSPSPANQVNPLYPVHD